MSAFPRMSIELHCPAFPNPQLMACTDDWPASPKSSISVNPLMLTAAKSSLTILAISLRQKDNLKNI